MFHDNSLTLSLVEQKYFRLYAKIIAQDAFFQS